MTTVIMIFPVANETIFVSDYYTLMWYEKGMPTDASYNVSLSTDEGASFTPIATDLGQNCGGLGNQFCSPADPAYVKVDVVQNGSLLASDVAGPFSIADGTGTVKVSEPRSRARFAQGTVQTIAWSHNYGLSSRFLLRLNRPGGAPIDGTDLSLSPPTTSASGSFQWIVKEPAAAQAEIRVNVYPGSTVGISGTFSIEAPVIKLPALPAGTKVSIGSKVNLVWQHNLGVGSKVKIEFSSNGGKSWGVIASDVKNDKPTAGRYEVVVTEKMRSNAAKVRISWAGEAKFKASTTSRTFVIS